MALSQLSQTELRTEPLTQPLSPRWIDRPAGYRDFESAFFVGHGRATFERCAEELLYWKVKIRSGFDIAVEPPGVAAGPTCIDAGPPGVAPVSQGDSTADPTRVRIGQEPTIFVRLGPFRLPEPARVIDVVESERRRGFTYATKPGHPITGEESFILIHTPDDRVFLVLRSVSRAGFGIWRLGEPFVRLAQIVYRRRYARALRD
ncbi:DUF1990 family protein [Brevibacterium marinum]|uniref:Uncharacterized protein (UPF0548 family) n=1 Tax=Brevibacterium marinum TaxID=418643 RepID=A0A846RXF1_9MICO|nr:DUF1990 domain-containing protein [Brevibacterium marinum]NJC55790.1 uncharacterized protein (UPF0548 family) [Brevibacterium marinum]